MSMTHKVCEDCCFREIDDCIHLNECLSQDDKYRAIAELKEKLPELMAQYDGKIIETCVFCKEGISLHDGGGNAGIAHKPDCLGKRLLRVL